MDKGYCQPTSAFETLAPELISRIALFTVADEVLSPTPPLAILSLALTSRSIAQALSLNDNSPLLFGIFCLKFDYAAIVRRFGTHSLTTIHFTAELKKRCRALKRIRAGCLDEKTLVDDLWTAFLMMLESDGFNERNLLDWANLPAFLAKCLQTAQNRGEVYEESPELSLAIWLIWMTSNDESLRTETTKEREIIMSILQPLVIAGYRYTSFYAPETFFRFELYPQSSGPRRSYIEHYHQTMTVCAPLLTPAAFLAMAVRLDFDQVNKSSSRGCLPSLPVNREAANALGVGGPTMEDMTELALSTRVKPWSRFSPSLVHKITSAEHDPDWCRITLCHDRSRLTLRALPFKDQLFVPGKLSGLWTGKLMVPELRAYRALLAGAPGTPSNRISMYQRPLYMRLREHHCFLTNNSVSCGRDNGEDDDFLNAWLPTRCTCVEDHGKACLDVHDPVTRRKFKYDTFVLGPDGSEKAFYPAIDAERARTIKSRIRHHGGGDPDEDVQLMSGVNDIIVTGETDPRHGDAWGHFTILGRVRPYDGLVVLRRKPTNPDETELGTWIFRGYVLSSGMLVGRWRETITGIDTPMLEGPFVMTKQ